MYKDINGQLKVIQATYYSKKKKSRNKNIYRTPRVMVYSKCSISAEKEVYQLPQYVLNVSTQVLSKPWRTRTRITKVEKNVKWFFVHLTETLTFVNFIEEQPPSFPRQT